MESLLQELARLNGSVSIRFLLLLVEPSGDVKMRGAHWSVICTIDLRCNKVGRDHNIVLMMGMFETFFFCPLSCVGGAVKDVKVIGCIFPLHEFLRSYFFFQGGHLHLWLVGQFSVFMWALLVFVRAAFPRM